MAKIGYARVSTKEQSLDAQLMRLEEAGCTKVFSEKVSGVRSKRPEYDKMLEYMREGDVLVVTKLDRLGRSVRQLVELIEELEARGIDFVSLDDRFDTSTPQGQLLFHISAAFAQLEREIIRERTIAGLEAARAKGHVGGRPKANLEKVAHARDLMESGMSVREACTMAGISPATYYRYRDKIDAEKGE